MTRSGEDGLTFENRRSMISAHALHDQWSERTRERRVNIQSKTTSRRQGSQQEDAAADCHGSRKRETGVWRLGDGASRITVAEPVSFVDFRRDRAILFLSVHPRDEREKTYSTDVVSHWARVTHWKTSGRATSAHAARTRVQHERGNRWRTREEANGENRVSIERKKKKETLRRTKLRGRNVARTRKLRVIDPAKSCRHATSRGRRR